MDTTSDTKFLMVFAVVMGVLTVIGVSVAVIANVAGSIDYGKSDGQVQLAAERLAPVGKVKLASQASGDSDQAAEVVKVAAVAATPESLYNTACAACHASGVAGAPKIDDKSAWAARLGKGVDGLTTSAINGLGLMPARGGSSLSDDEIKSVVEYMLDALQ